MINADVMNRFLAISWLYLMMNEEILNEMSIDEIEDLIIALNDEPAGGSGSYLV